ncbi:MAG: hypothetical protein U1D30_08000 [Planctomycetota bacterium]
MNQLTSYRLGLNPQGLGYTAQFEADGVGSRIELRSLTEFEGNAAKLLRPLRISEH